MRVRAGTVEVFFCDHLTSGSSNCANNNDCLLRDSRANTSSELVKSWDALKATEKYGHSLACMVSWVVFCLFPR